MRKIKYGYCQFHKKPVKKNGVKWKCTKDGKKKQCKNCPSFLPSKDDYHWMGTHYEK